MQLDDSLRRLVGADEALSDKSRVAIMIYLAMKGPTRFKELQEGLGLTPGNLASHLRRLEEKGYVRIRRTLLDARTRVIAPTPLGLSALVEFISVLRRMVDAADIQKPAISSERSG